MKVLVLGLPRTGTQSLADALAILGISPVYHMREVAKNNHQDKWLALCQTKFEGKGENGITRQQFDEILNQYEALCDYPAAIFPEELLELYPEAKVILSVRDEDGWYKSMMSTLIHAHTHAPPGVASPQTTLRNYYHLHCWNDDFPNNGRLLFQRHNALVREASKEREYLEYHPGDGWDSLCNFLGLPVPEEPFPRSDDWAAYKLKHAKND